MRKNPRIYTDKDREYKRTHRKQIALVTRAYMQRIRMSALEILGGKCCRCGFDDIRALQVDHINGGGYKELRGHTNHAARVIKSVLAKENKYQLLCANCNWIKRVENGEVNRKYF